MKKTPSFVFIIWSAWFLLIYGVVITYSLPTPIIKYDIKKNLITALPQGWGFFTRNPQEATVEAYAYSNSELELISKGNTSLSNMLGFSRKSRYIGYELGTLLRHVPKKAWVNEKGEYLKNEIPPDPTIILSTDSIQQSLKFFPKGEYVFYQYKMIPFAWANNSQEQYRPYLVARLRII
jgi:antimicrobial peptide system SdpA family protein